MNLMNNVSYRNDSVHSVHGRDHLRTTVETKRVLFSDVNFPFSLDIVKILLMVLFYSYAAHGLQQKSVLTEMHGVLVQM